MDEKTKEVLFKLAKSHSKLAQAEYNRNPSYNNEHFSHEAEELLITFLQTEGLLKEFMDYVDQPTRWSEHPEGCNSETDTFFSC